MSVPTLADVWGRIVGTLPTKIKRQISLLIAEHRDWAQMPWRDFCAEVEQANGGALARAIHTSQRERITAPGLRALRVAVRAVRADARDQPLAAVPPSQILAPREVATLLAGFEAARRQRGAKASEADARRVIAWAQEARMSGALLTMALYQGAALDIDEDGRIMLVRPHDVRA